MQFMKHEDISLIAEIVAGQVDFQSDPKQFFSSLLRRAGLPNSWIRQKHGQWSGDVDADAYLLVQWAANQGTVEERPGYTTLGCILEVLLKMVGREQGQALAIRIIAYQLYRDEKMLAGLAQRYSIPWLLPEDTKQPVGPDFTWYGSSDEVELQSFLPREAPEFLDVGFMEQAVKCSRSICRIEIPVSSGTAYGTGFLIAPNLVLTNHHVIAHPNPDDIFANARSLTLRFGYIAGEDRNPVEGTVFRLDSEQPILDFRPTELLDYALLKVEEKVKYATNVTPASYELREPTRRGGLQILQHPLRAGTETDVMQLGFSDSGITGVYLSKSRIQYVTKTLPGSSGAPCFNDDWKVVALHRAERRLNLVTIREGILISAIYNEIREHLS
jgi:V8-like Glu-specific endopeptidase